MTIENELDEEIEMTEEMPEGVLFESDTPKDAMPATAAPETGETTEPKQSYGEKRRDMNKQTYALRDETAMKVAGDSRECRGFAELVARMDAPRSTGNCLLIYGTRPNASLVKTHDEWEKLGAHVKRGEKAIRIMVREENEDKTKSWFRAEPVFDVSQTEGGTLSPAATKTHDTAMMHSLLQKVSYVKCTSSDTVEAGTGAYYDNDARKIYLEKGLEPTKAFQVLAREVAHAGISISLGQKGELYDRSENEFRADLTAYMICKHYGVDTKGMKISPSKSLSDKKPAEIIAELSISVDVYKDVRNRADTEIKQERQKKSPSRDDGR